jgi:hypothetical protein
MVGDVLLLLLPLLLLELGHVGDQCDTSFLILGLLSSAGGEFSQPSYRRAGNYNRNPPRCSWF